jgi:GT2 family glycosyltransferase
MATTPVSTRAPTEAKTATAPSVLAVVVTHRGRRWIRECLTALNTQTYGLLDVLVVDDASPDFREPPHLKRIVKRHLRRRRWGFLRTPRSLGFGGAINWALSRVRTDADLLLFIHDDAVLDPDSVARLVDRLALDDDIAITGPKVVSWDEPDRLEEVGMAVDRFGYPYKGLEEGEIDLGQHDTPNEVFYVTSTCMLVRHEVFRQLRGFDSRMGAYAEDLDLCWRARIGGHSVRVEPEARARHAIALATGRRQSRFRPARYFIRRNRLRTIAKNVSAPRLASLLPQYLLLLVAEMLGFIVLRQPREVLNLTRALIWNLGTSPQTLSERRRVQKIRRVRDRALRRFMVRQSTRVRFYLANQAGRLEETWGRRAEIMSDRGRQARAYGRRARGWPAAAAALVVAGVVLGFRDFLWAPQVAVSELLPYPEAATGMWRSFASPWLASGVGQPAPMPPAFAFLGIFSMVALGGEGAAQKLMVAFLGGLAFAGTYRLVAALADRPAGLTAGLVYLFGAVGYSGIRGGSLGALVFGAAAPFALHSLLRLCGWTRPPGWSTAQETARLSIAAAVSAAFVPGSLALYGAALVLVWSSRLLLQPNTPGSLKSLLTSVSGLVVGWALLLPWSATWLDPGGPLRRLLEEESPRFASAFAGHGGLSVVLGQTPEGPVLFGLALPLLGLVAVLAGEGPRRWLALALWLIVAASALLVGAVASGAIEPLVATPAEVGVLPALAFAGLAGLAVGAFRLDLPHRGLSVVHALSLGGLALAAFLIVVGLGPALWNGAWVPGGEGGKAEALRRAQLTSIMSVQAEREGQFRVLWVGRRWSAGEPSAARPAGDHFVTRASGQSLRDLFEDTSTDASRALEGVIAAVREEATDRAGKLLGAFNIRYAVVEPGPKTEPWLAQRDLAVARSEPDFLLLENPQSRARAALYNAIPAHVKAIDEDVEAEADPGDVERRSLARVAGSEFAADDVNGPGELFVAEGDHTRWRAYAGETELDRIDTGWGNAFSLPAVVDTRLVVRFDRPLSGYAWLTGFVIAWIFILGVAFPRRREQRWDRLGDRGTADRGHGRPRPKAVR